MNAAWIANCLWKQSAKGDWRSFTSAKADLQSTQKILLKKILKAATSTSFADRFRLSSQMSVEEFQGAVPVTNYAEHYEKNVALIRQGSQNVLTNQPVSRLVPTTGSTGNFKLIPYTTALKKSFQRVVNTWVYDLACNFPEAFRGRSYWSVTPVVEQQYGDSEIPIGFESDEEYLSPIGRLLAKRAIVDAPRFVSGEVADTVILLTALKLISEPRLSLISVWSPTLLLNILNAIRTHRDDLLSALHSGSDRVVNRLESASSVQLKRNPKRARLLEKLLDSLDSQESFAQSIWPHLSLISCWGDAGSKSYFDRLKALEPEIPIQAKGLLATEGAVSFPLGGMSGHVPAIESTFLEFLPTSNGRDVKLLDQLGEGEVYEVLITTFGGLYRYATGDQIKVVEIRDGLPCFEFVGRTNEIIDLVGEKVPVQVFRDVISELSEQADATERFWIVSPTVDSPAHYRIYISGSQGTAEVGESILKRMRDNPHFVNAEALGQIVPPEIRVLPDSFTMQSFQSLKTDLGFQLGALKESRVEYSSRVMSRLDQLSHPLEYHSR